MTPENQRDEEVKIYYDDEYLTIPEAISKLTPEEIDRGDHCNQTIIDLVSALTAQRQSWERELEATKDYARQLADKGIALEKEKAGLEERVRELEIKLLIAQEKTERVRDEWREAKNGFLITDNVKAQELTRLKSRNEELEARLAHNANSVPGSKESYMAQVESQQNEISRLKAKVAELEAENGRLRESSK